MKKVLNNTISVNTSIVLKILYELLDTRKLIFDGNKFIMLKEVKSFKEKR